MLLAILLVMATSASPLAPGDHRRTLAVDGVEREYLLHIPATVGDEPAPVVLAFHGGGSNAEQMIQFCGLNETADQHGFIAVYPNGAGRVARARTWNAGNCCGYAQRQQIDDVKFVGSLLDDLKQTVRIQERRIYATGMSNGAMMCYRLASELSDRIAAIAPVAGPMGTESCHPTRAVPVCHFHGTADQFAPFGGGRGSRSLTRTNFYSVERSIREWVTANGCRQEAIVEDLPATVEDETRIARATHGGGRDGAEVVLYTIHGGGHTWPGREPQLRYLGPSTRNLSANAVMWEFFQRFSLPSPDSD
jgi:polyhydroxybutyrate depolymerase